MMKEQDIRNLAIFIVFTHQNIFSKALFLCAVDKRISMAPYECQHQVNGRLYSMLQSNEQILMSLFPLQEELRPSSVHQYECLFDMRSSGTPEWLEGCDDF